MAGLQQQGELDAESTCATDVCDDEGEKKKKRRIWILLLLLLALLFAGLAAYTLYLNQPADDMEPNVIVGPMEDMTDEEIQAMLNNKLAEGMMGFAINATIGFENADAKGKIKFENPGNNAKLLKLEIKRDDNGQTIYSTGYLAPGSYVDEDELDVKLDPGTYTCTARISSYKEDTKAYIGEAAAAVTIVILH